MSICVHKEGYIGQDGSETQFNSSCIESYVRRNKASFNCVWRLIEDLFAVEQALAAGSTALNNPIE